MFNPWTHTFAQRLASDLRVGQKRRVGIDIKASNLRVDTLVLLHVCTEPRKKSVGFSARQALEECKYNFAQVAFKGNAG